MIDPLALQVLRATCDSLKKADAFSFNAFVSRERLGSNDQIITTFNQQNVTVDRPDKLRVDLKTPFNNVILYDDAGKAVLFAPDEKLYATLDAAKTIEQTLDNLDKREISLAIAPMLRSDPYKRLADGLESAAVIDAPKSAENSSRSLPSPSTMPTGSCGSRAGRGQRLGVSR